MESLPSRRMNMTHRHSAEFKQKSVRIALSSKSTLRCSQDGVSSENKEADNAIGNLVEMDTMMRMN